MALYPYTEMHQKFIVISFTQENPMQCMHKQSQAKWIKYAVYMLSLSTAHDRVFSVIVLYIMMVVVPCVCDMCVCLYDFMYTKIIKIQFTWDVYSVHDCQHCHHHRRRRASFDNSVSLLGLFIISPMYDSAEIEWGLHCKWPVSRYLQPKVH